MARLMDPIDATIDAVGTITDSYRTVNTIIDLPQAFRQVEKSLPIVRAILERAKVVIDHDNKGACTVMEHCMSSAKQLSLIYYELETRIQRDEEATSWAQAQALYHNAIGGTNANLVESLMVCILSDLQELISRSPWEITSRKTAQDLATAIQKLLAVEPSLSDDQMNDNGPRNQQTNKDRSTVSVNHFGGDGRYSVNNVSGANYHFGQGSSAYFGPVVEASLVKVVLSLCCITITFSLGVSSGAPVEE